MTVPFHWREAETGIDFRAYAMPRVAQAPTGDALGAAFRQARGEGPGIGLWRWATQGPGRDIAEGLFTPEEEREPLLDPDDANERFAIEGRLRFDRPVSERWARELNEIHQARRQREDIMARAAGGITGWTPRIAALFLGAAMDPLNVAAAFVPVVGPTRAAAWMQQAATRLQRVQAAARRGAIEGAVGGAALAPVDWFVLGQQQIDYGAADALLNVAFGGALGASLRGGGRAMIDAFSGWHGSAGHEALVRQAVAQVSRADPVSVDDLAAVHRAVELARRRDELMAGAASIRRAPGRVEDVGPGLERLRAVERGAFGGDRAPAITSRAGLPPEIADLVARRAAAQPVSRGTPDLGEIDPGATLRQPTPLERALENRDWFLEELDQIVEARRVVEPGMTTRPAVGAFAPEQEVPAAPGVLGPDGAPLNRADVPRIEGASTDAELRARMLGEAREGTEAWLAEQRAKVLAEVSDDVRGALGLERVLRPGSDAIDGDFLRTALARAGEPPLDPADAAGIDAARMAASRARAATDASAAATPADRIMREVKEIERAMAEADDLLRAREAAGALDPEEAAAIARADEAVQAAQSRAGAWEAAAACIMTRAGR